MWPPTLVWGPEVATEADPPLPAEVPLLTPEVPWTEDDLDAASEIELPAGAWNIKLLHLIKTVKLFYWLFNLCTLKSMKINLVFPSCTQSRIYTLTMFYF